MQRVNVAIFLLAIALLGLAPVVLASVAVARRRRTPPDADVPPRRGRSELIVAALSAIALAGAVTAWTLSGRAAQGDAAAEMPGMGSGEMTGMAMPDGSSLRLPDRVAGLPMMSTVVGQAAIEQVSSLHSGSFQVVEAAIASYGDGRVVVWASRAPSRADAVDQVMTMSERIAGGGTPFSTPVQVRTRARVYRTIGMQQVHFFFPAGPMVWWVAAPHDLSRLALNDLVEVSR